MINLAIQLALLMIGMWAVGESVLDYKNKVYRYILYFTSTATLVNVVYMGIDLWERL